MNNEKIYGSSILNNDERLITEDNSIFDDMKDFYTDNEINNMRNELKETSEIHTKDKICKDVLSGITSSEKIKKTDNSDNISDTIDVKDKSGKEISLKGVDLIYNLLDTKPTTDELKSLSEYFDNITSMEDIYATDILVLKNILGSRISEKLIEVSNKNNISEYESITRFIIEIYKCYINVVQYNDDVNELYDLVMKVSDNLKMDNDNNPESLLDQYKILSNATDSLKKLDERNKKLKNDYKITDFDILAIDSVKECLESALSFKDIYDKIIFTSVEKYKKDRKKIRNTISNWINDLKNDTETLYTLPVNDYLTSDESTDAMIDYIKGFIMLQDNNDIYNQISEYENDNESTDLITYFLKNGYVTKNQIENYEKSAMLLMYLLAKTFKKKKIKDNNDRRVLSYTLDILSKVSDVAYASRLMKLINYASEKFLKINSYNYLSNNN